MGKLPQLLCLIALAMLSFGTLFMINNPIFWMASTGVEYQLLRAALAGLIIAQIYTLPPRSMRFRRLNGIAAGLLILLTIHQIYTFNMQLLDMLVFMGASFLLLAVALERNIVEVVTPKPFTVRVHRVSAQRVNA